MAYINQTEKAAIAPVVKSILNKYNLKGTLSIKHHSTLSLCIKSGVIDFGDSKGQQVNTYWIDSHYQGVAKDALNELASALRGEGWYDNSDIQSDYFNVKHYIAINIGKWDTPYILTK